MTVTAFSKTLRALERNRSGALLAWLAVTIALMTAIGAWMFYARVELDETADEARIEIDGPAYTVQAPVTGRVSRVNQALGRDVHAGDILIEMDSSREQLQVTEEQSRNQGVGEELTALQGEIAVEHSSLEVERNASRAAVEEARAKTVEASAPLKQAEQEKSQATELSREGLIPRRELDRAVSEAGRLQKASQTAAAAVVRLETEQAKREKDREVRIAALQSQIAKLKADQLTNTASVRLAQRDLASRRIFAPVSGRIGDAPLLAPGSVLREGDRVASIVPSGSLRIVAQFPPAAAHGRIRAGQLARMRLSGYPWTEFGVVEAEVTAVGGEDSNGKVRVELALRNSATLKVPLRHGMPGAVEVEVERISPLALLLRQAGQWMRQGKSQ